MTCIFCKMVTGELAVDFVYEDTTLIVIRDVKPQAPTHLLIIPKEHIATINDTTDKQEALLGHMILTAKKIATEQQLEQDGYRLVLNVNSGGGQAVYHIHLHLLGGRQMTWPPG